MDYEYAIPHLEWEAVAYPLNLHNPEFKDAAYVFDGSATITLWREQDLQLKATMQVWLKDPLILDEDKLIGKANITKQHIVTALDDAGHKVILQGCVMSSYHFNSYTVSENGYLVDMELIFDTARIIYSEQPTEQHLEWFLVQHFPGHLYGTTRRSLQAAQKKIRIGVDPEPPDERLIGSSRSRDYFELKHNDFSCIVSRVPKEFKVAKMDGVCFEFRNHNIARVNPALMDDLKSLLSILCGGRLYYMGYSKISDGELVEAFVDSPDLPTKLPVAMQPVHYNMQYDWGNLELQMNLLFPKYRALQPKLFLNNAVERFWISQTVPIGANLPILAGGLEVMANAYLKLTGNDRSVYLPKKDYELILKDELSAIAEKLAKLEGGKVMLNKISSAFQIGSNEKINLFFELLELEIGKPEKDAIRLRNIMTHSRRDYSITDNAHDDLISTRVYQVLFTRIFLKILGFQGYFLDYSLKGSVSKPL